MSEILTGGGAPTEPTSDEKTMACLAHASIVVAWMIGPLIIWATQKDKSSFVAFHAMQALVFQVVSFIVVMVIALLTCGFGAILVPLPMLWAILHAVKAYEGEWKAFPLIENVGR